MSNLESEPEVSQSSNVDLTNQLSDIHDRDQDLLANNILRSNIPEISGENTTHTACMLVAAKIGVKIKARDFVSAEHVGGRRINATQATAPVETRPRFLVVRLARRDLRDELAGGSASASRHDNSGSRSICRALRIEARYIYERLTNLGLFGAAVRRTILFLFIFFCVVLSFLIVQLSFYFILFLLCALMA